ncbi:MAG: response regulator [Candidatus Omnitrophica bacterium]|nr:response regulator [Candidatus Omnitrophota bacterium]
MTLGTNRKKILYVEDDDANQYYMRLMVEEYGCSLDLASDGQEALEKVKANKYDLIFMDLRMPVMDGFQVTRRIREFIDKSVLIVAVSANVFDGTDDQCFSAGMNGFIGKGSDIEKFKNEVLFWLEKSRPQPARKNDKNV